MDQELDRNEIERLNNLKAKERMRLPRQPMPEQEPEARRANFSEVPFGYTPMVAIVEANRCIQCKKPTCVIGCPVGINIPGFIRHIAGVILRRDPRDRDQHAARHLWPRVPQEAQCEQVCVLAKRGDPVAIGRLERFAADWEREYGLADVPPVGAATGKSVGVVGSGPAGLTVAIDLRRAGHAVTIYEALHLPGGVLMYGIPEFRLPKAIVNAEVDVVQKMGVTIEYNTIIGQIETVDELLERHDAVFLGTGAGLPWFMDLPGENLCGVYSANEYLTRCNLMRAYDFPRYDTPIAASERIAVIGGGNVAMDVARTAIRLGAKEVYLIYRSEPRCPLASKRSITPNKRASSSNCCTTRCAISETKTGACARSNASGWNWASRMRRAAAARSWSKAPNSRSMWIRWSSRLATAPTRWCRARPTTWRSTRSGAPWSPT